MSEATTSTADARRKWLDLFADACFTDTRPGLEFERFDVEGNNPYPPAHAVITVYGPEGLRGERGMIVVEIDPARGDGAEVEFSWGGRTCQTLRRIVRGVSPQRFYDGITDEYRKWWGSTP